MGQLIRLRMDISKLLLVQERCTSRVLERRHTSTTQTVLPTNHSAIQLLTARMSQRQQRLRSLLLTVMHQQESIILLQLSMKEQQQRIWLFWREWVMLQMSQSPRFWRERQEQLRRWVQSLKRVVNTRDSQSWLEIMEFCTWREMEQRSMCMMEEILRQLEHQRQTQMSIHLRSQMERMKLQRQLQ